MRIVLLGIFCLLMSVSAQAQKENQRDGIPANNLGMLLSQIGKSLYDYEVAATSTDSIGAYQWNFLLAESGLRSQVNKEVADELTAFSFTFNPKTVRYNGEVVRTKEGVAQEEVLAMIYQQLQQNMRQYGRNIDFVRIDGKYFYVLYFPYEN